jgi:hypothetical protein
VVNPMLDWSASARTAARPSAIADLMSLPGTLLADYLQLSTLNQRKSRTEVLSSDSGGKV